MIKGPSINTATRRRLAIAACVLFALAAAGFARVSSEGTVRVTAQFSAAVGVYSGSEVRLMGVPIGEVTKVDAGNDYVTVGIEYDGEHVLPEDVQAVIVSPSIIADRFVQMVDPKDGSERALTSGDVIPLERTRVPIELDEIFGQADQLLAALGPGGANKDGALSRALEVGAENLQGNGDELNRALDGLGDLSATLGDSSSELFATVRHVQALTSELVENDGDVRRFNRQMAQVGTFLAEDRQEISHLFMNLSDTFKLVQRFVRQNRESLTSNVDNLARVARAIDSQRASLETLLRVTPVGFNNLNRAFDEELQAVRSRANLDQLLKDPGGLLCDELVQAGILPSTDGCAALADLLEGRL